MFVGVSSEKINAEADNNNISERPDDNPQSSTFISAFIFLRYESIKKTTPGLV